MEIDYGPIRGLIGTFKGDKGIDIAPDKEKDREENLFVETITFSEAGEIVNANEQRLAALHYHQIITRKEDNIVIHNQTGYWMWDKEKKVVMHSIAIPRGLCLLASGTAHVRDDGEILLKAVSDIKHEDYTVVQSRFLKEKAKTVAFDIKIRLKENELHYYETTLVDIYGAVFEHTDTNTLHKVD